MPTKNLDRLAVLAVRRIHHVRGLRARIARELKTDYQNVASWKMIPLQHVFNVARIIKAAPETLRPDFFIQDPLRAEQAAQHMAATANAYVTPRPPRVKLTEEHKRVWLNHSLRFNRDAVATIQATVSVGTVTTDLLRHKFGPSGRTKETRKTAQAAAALAARNQGTDHVRKKEGQPDRHSRGGSGSNETQPTGHVSNGARECA